MGRLGLQWAHESHHTCACFLPCHDCSGRHVSYAVHRAMEPTPIQHDDRGADNLSPSSGAHLAPAQAEHIIAQVQRELDAEVASQNYHPTKDYSKDNPMREVSNLASTMREAIAALKQRTGAAISNFQSELGNTHANLDKVDSVTHELKEANKEVESMLGDTGSNFPTSDDTTRPVDENGVWVNPEAKK